MSTGNTVIEAKDVFRAFIARSNDGKRYPILALQEWYYMLNKLT